MPYNVSDYEKLILRDFLAIDRTKLANTRTFLAYLRTAIMMAVSGITFLKLLPQLIALRYIGYALLPLSVAVILIGTFQYFRHKGRITLESAQIRQFEKEVEKDVS